MSFNLASTLQSAVADALRSNPGIIETQNWSLRQKVLAIVNDGSPEVRTKFLRTVAGGSNAEITTRAKAVIAPCYATAQPWSPVVGDGCNVWDADGNQLLDFYGCVAVVNLGHSHPDLLKAMEAQSALLLTGGNGCMNPATVRFCERLVQETFGVGMGKVFPCNSGADANETAIRLARFFGHPTGRYEIICMNDSFHGRSLATTAATGQVAMQARMSPLPEGFIHVPYNDPEAVRAAITDKTAAVLVEPVQCEGGFIFPDPGYLSALRAICDEHKILLMVDEVQTGAGRLGSLFAYQASGIVPDVISIAKGIGGGLPVGACVAKNSVMELLTSHGNTYGGNAFCMAGALAVLEAESAPAFLDYVRFIGSHLLTGLRGLQGKYPNLVSGVRGQGLLAAVNLNSQIIDNKVAVAQLRSKGVVVGPLKTLGLRISPALVVTQNQVDRFLAVLDVYFGELTV